MLVWTILVPAALSSRQVAHALRRDDRDDRLTRPTDLVIDSDNDLALVVANGLTRGRLYAASRVHVSPNQAGSRRRLHR